MEFKIGDRIEALKDEFIERDSFHNTLIYKKGTRGKILYICKDDLIVKFDSGYGDCKWCIPKEKAKLVNENEMGLENIPKIIQQYENNLKEKWNKFEKENILINCETKEDFEDFINFACKNFDLDYLIYKDCFEEVGNELCFNFINNDLFYGDRTYYVSQEEYNDFKILTWSEFMKDCKANNMEKTFKEVIRDIKKGEIWESEYKKIYFNSFEQIQIESQNNDQNIMAFDDSIMYTLKRKKYDFEDAFEAYKDGKEIESCDTQTRYIYDDADLYFDKNESDWLEINYWLIDEINGKWYIND